MKPLIKIKNTLLENSPLTFFIASFIVYFLTSAGETPYDYFTRLALAFKNGRYWLTENPPWLNELIPAGENKFFVAYPPMPALLATLPTILLNRQVSQTIFAHVVGAAFAFFTTKLALSFSKKTSLAIWAGLLGSIGTITFFLAANGSVWYLGQLTAAMFLLAGLAESKTKKRPVILGLLVGGAYLARVHTVLAMPVFLYYLWGKEWKKNILQFALAFAPFVLFNAFYNFVRFGVFWDKGYLLIPGVLDEPWYEKGLVHPSYIFAHLKILFGALPNFSANFPFATPSWSGLAIWLTTPAFIFALKNKLTKETVFNFGAILTIGLVVVMHGTTGFSQFGYRFAVDFYPFLILLTLRAVSKQKLRPIHWALLTFGIVVNLWGVLWINKFGWVSY